VNNDTPPKPSDWPPRGDFRPIPDPTILTTQQLGTAVSSLREIIEARLDAMDKAIVLIQNKADRVPSEVDVAVAHLESLHEEKFRSIATQFRERDTRAEQSSRDSKVAVDAALQAAKEAVNEQNKSNAVAISKSEASFIKQIDQMGTIINTMASSLNDKIDDLKARLTAIEGQKKGSQDVWGWIIGALGIGIAIAAVAATLVARHV
jgi:hypothetical protein